MYKYHLKLGIWTSIIIFSIALTGLFLRPPFMAFILNGQFNERLNPGFKQANLWHDKIRNVMYDSLYDRLIIDCKDGLWASRNGTLDKFEEVMTPVPIFAMGATVFEQDSNFDLLIGSFSGLFRINMKNKFITDELTGAMPISSGSFGPSGSLITGYFKTPKGNSYATTHFTGLIPIGHRDHEISLQMPKEAKDNYNMSLWNYLFEIHNGRIFEAWIGDWYILLVPLGSLMFIILSITGVYDWIYKYLKKKKKNLNINEYHEEELIEN